MKDLIRFINDLLLDAISPTGQDLELMRKCSASILLLVIVLEILGLPHILSLYGTLLAFILFNVLIVIKKNKALELDRLYSDACKTADKLKNKLKELDNDISS